MDRPLRIGLDLDGVIIDHRPNKLRVAAEMGFAFEPWQLNTNILSGHMPQPAYDDFRNRIYRDLTAEAPPVQGALEAIRQLRGELFIVSARHEGNGAQAADWIERNGLNERIPKDHVIFCSRKEDKPGHCERLGIGVFLDDQLAVLDLLPPGMRRLLFDDDRVSHKLAVSDGIERMFSWDDVLNAL